MAQYTVVYWQDIPSVVEAKQGRKRHKKQLSQRFQELIDTVAMRKGLFGTDEYLEEWHKGSAVSAEGDVEEIAKRIAAELESKYDEIEKAALAQASEVRRQRPQ